MAEAEDMEAEEQEEVPDATTPTTKRAPIGMTVAEWNVHKLTHLLDALDCFLRSSITLGIAPGSGLEDRAGLSALLSNSP